MERARRTDARSNRDRILTVAEDVFGRGGDTASTEEVARLAGVGIATVFRHFPTKTALLRAVLIGRLNRLRDQAAALLDAPDPGAAFFEFFGTVVADAAGKLAITNALVDAGGDNDPAVIEAGQELRTGVGALLDRAQQARAVRADLALPEVYALLIGSARAAAYAGLDAELRAKTLAIVFDGLRHFPSGEQH
ncbi:MAG TPA: TetR/AcrR family transcriptional regulator [Pseudonocardiaceae bacterium]|nr:TetR/AcrR family transcriptional regulator [Pseudonocardiaceae bacterium]